MVNFELRKHLWGVADIGAIVETRTQIYSRNCLSFFEFPCFLALGNKQNNFLNYLLYYWRGTYCYRCVCSSYLWCNKWNFNRLSHALKSPPILLRSPNFDCYLLVFVKRCGRNGGRPRLPGLVKDNDSDTFQRSHQECSVAQCYMPGTTHFYLWGRIYTFLLLYVHSSVDAAFIKLPCSD